MLKHISRLTAAAIVSCLATHAIAQTKVAIGTLTCRGGEGVGLILGSRKFYDCSFAPNATAQRDDYRATVTKIGVDIGITGRTTMVWTVLAATNDYRRGMLLGNYAGAAADAAIGVGGGAKVLVGGSQDSIVLQPLSIQGQTGINLAVGVAGMTLR